MDVLTQILQTMAAELGPEVLDAPTLDEFERRFRIQIGGDRHYIASIAALERRRRHDRIRAALSQGLTASEVASRFGMTRQAVWLIGRSSTAEP